jgi:uncharacterized protein YqjF (DUF2071 family)
MQTADPVVMYQDWHHLLFLHWEVPPEQLQALLPKELTVDTFDGKAYVGLVPFTVSGVRPPFLPPLPGVSSFHEINVRTYVHRGGSDPGVWFFSLDASSTLAVNAARLAYKLPYFHAEMSFRESGAPLPEIEFDTHRDDCRGARPANAHIRYGPADGVVTHASPGTIDHFLLERYLLYAVDDDHQLYRARVSHQPYPMQRAETSHVDETLIWAAAIRRPESAPLRHYAREVNVKVSPPEKC